MRFVLRGIARALAAAVAAARATKGRLMAVALAVAVPVLAALLAVNLFGVSAADLFTPAPPAAVARREAQADLDAMVQGIEGFRDDYAALPDSLAEVASTPPGT